MVERIAYPIVHRELRQLKPLGWLVTNNVGVE